ncbi:isochorismatase family protein [Nonomuraea sp. NPDC047897]|uniref:isochorismatase family protein n=1 Tax=Nonomuraea sp. NPDC047897 TaxID=3364346 RepID=UPI003716C7B7
MPSSPPPAPSCPARTPGSPGPPSGSGSTPSPEPVVRHGPAFRRHGAPVVLVRLTAGADGSDAAPGRTEIPRPPGPLPAGWDVVVDDLAGHPGDVTVTKRTWSAFHGTDLDLRLRRRGGTQLVLAGIATSIGVESTAPPPRSSACWPKTPSPREDR